jgi:hypothetical protein
MGDPPVGHTDCWEMEPETLVAFRVFSYRLRSLVIAFIFCSFLPIAYFCLVEKSGGNVILGVMPENPTVGSPSVVRLPKRLFLFTLIVSELVPFLARLMIVPVRGWEWLTDYIPDVGAILFLAALNFIPAIWLYALGRTSKRAPLAFWFAAAGGLSFLLWAYGTINIRASSTAALGLLFIPIYAAIAATIGWAIGLIAHASIKSERIRQQLARSICLAALVVATGITINDASAVAKREARFPIVAVREADFVKRIVYPCCPSGSVEVLVLDNFDSDSENEIAVLGTTGIALLKPIDYTVKSKFDFAREDCDGCVHMHPYLVRDGRGSLLVASSDGVADRQGHLLWALKASGFTRLVPIQLSTPGPAFLAYHNSDRIDLHNTDGKVLWSVKVGVSDIGAYVTPEGQRLPFAITGYGKSRGLNLYDHDGNLQRRIPLPEWASNIESIAWPRPGHLLVGSGGGICVLDTDGKEVLRHTIRGISFDPYHGPDGTAVRFDSAKEPYLAVMSHGSSGYARSVLLIFDPDGHLVWQEEVNKLRASLAVPAGERKGEVLLVGGMDGVIEYSLPRREASK